MARHMAKQEGGDMVSGQVTRVEEDGCEDLTLMLFTRISTDQYIVIKEIKLPTSLQSPYKANTSILSSS
jgi:hypothetical protein